MDSQGLGSRTKRALLAIVAACSLLLAGCTDDGGLLAGDPSDDTSTPIQAEHEKPRVPPPAEAGRLTGEVGYRDSGTHGFAIFGVHERLTVDVRVLALGLDGPFRHRSAYELRVEGPDGAGLRATEPTLGGVMSGWERYVLDAVDAGQWSITLQSRDPAPAEYEIRWCAYSRGADIPPDKAEWCEAP